MPTLLRVAAHGCALELSSPLQNALSRLARPQALPYAHEALSSPDEAVRNQAVTWLVSVEPFDRETVRLLGKAIGNKSERRHTSAAEALYHLGPLARGAVPPLRDCLDSVSYLQLASAQCDPDAASTLLEWIVSPSEGTRLLAFRLLPFARLDPAVFVHHLTRGLQEHDTAVPAQAAWILTAMAPEYDGALRVVAEFLHTDVSPRIARSFLHAGGNTTAVLKEIIATHPDEPQLEAQRLLAHLWRAAGKLEPDMLDSLAGRGQLQPHEAALLLADLGPAAKEAIPALESAMTGCDLDLRAAATVALAALEPEKCPPVDWLLAVLQRDGLAKRSAPAQSRPGPPGLVDAFRDAIIEGTFDLRAPCWAALAHAGPVATEAILSEPDLVTVEKLEFLSRQAECGTVPSLAIPWLLRCRSNPDFAAEADSLLEDVGPGDRAAADAMRPLLEGNNRERDLAMTVIVRLGEPAIPVLLELLPDGDERAWTHALHALYALQLQRPLQGEQLEICLRALRSANRSVQIAAVGVFYAKDAPLERALPLLLEYLRASSPYVAVQAAKVLSRHSAAIPGLTAALRDASEQTRCLAAFSLGRMAATAEPALPALEAAATDDESDLVRATAEDAVRALRPAQASGKIDRGP